MSKNISIVIPIYNEFENVKKIIDNLMYLEDVYEVIFVDSSNDDKSKSYIEKISDNINLKYISSEKGRALQMNSGYKESTGDVVLFLHCDSIVEFDLIEKISKAVEDGVEFGCLSIYFDDKRLLMKICGYQSRKRAVKRKIAFGDQGMFFTRELFDKLGGFKEIPIMEDYDISIRAKEVTSLVQIDSKIITSSRKYYLGKGIFNKGILSCIGILLTMYEMQVFQKQFREGVSPEEIVKKYYK